jgi:hypothetical protein
MPDGADRSPAANRNGSNFKTGISSMPSSTTTLDTPFPHEKRWEKDRTDLAMPCCIQIALRSLAFQNNSALAKWL